MANTSIYQDIAKRTGGNIYLGIVGPVRTGKSTFIKRFMEELVIPNIHDVYRQERARDELPQSGSGRTIMTAEPKFIPEEAVTISPDPQSSIRVRLIDSVGYMVEGAVGAMEDGQPRMVTTPWYPEEIPMTQAAELGTRKVMEEHCTVGIVVTTDGTITDISRQDYAPAEARAIQDMQATGKPFLVLINSTDPNGSNAQSLQQQLEQDFSVSCLCVDCLQLEQTQICEILRSLLYEFPLRELQFYLPGWLLIMGNEHALRNSLYALMRQSAADISRICEAEPAIRQICSLEEVSDYRIRSIDLGSGIVSCELLFPQKLFYQILQEESGFEISTDRELVELLRQFAEMKLAYEKVAPALEEVRATGYGVVVPLPEEMQLEKPELIKKGGTFGIKLKASAPTIHMMRADLLTEISPMVGDEKQTQALVEYMLGEYENAAEKVWESNIFGRTVFEMMNDGFSNKLRHMPEEARFKFKNALTRIVNEGANGLICIIL